MAGIILALAMAGGIAARIPAEEPEKAPVSGGQIEVAAEKVTYPIVSTNQQQCFDDARPIAYPQPGEAYFGQDAEYVANPPRYKNNGNGTVSDLVTGLMWRQDPGKKRIYSRIVADVKACRTGGYKDWRLPTIKELYSLILFSGRDVMVESNNVSNLRPFIDNKTFKFTYGRASDGDRIIDSQFATQTINVSKIMGDKTGMFGVNFADGRIKCYPIDAMPGRGAKTFYALYVRGNPAYGKNRFKDNKDGTITDLATGLTWMQADSGTLKAGKKKDGAMNWKDALVWAEKLEYAGHDDWRLPSAKELQSIVDYSRSPEATNSAAIDPIFKTTPIKNEQGEKDYAFYWTGTTHASKNGGNSACYLSFGRASGFMKDRRTGQVRFLDVHGAGAQRSDPKAGDASKYPQGHGPQGDVIRIDNMVRCIRGGGVKLNLKGPKLEKISARPSRPGGDNQRPPNRAGRSGTSDPFILREDKNGDGKISRSEFSGPRSHFDRFDKNKDGYISEGETPNGPPPRR